MKIQHTPGPWQMIKDEFGTYDLMAIAGKFKIGIGRFSFSFGRSSKQQEANAILISAAPDLLDALQELQSKWISADHYWGSPTNEKVEAAIKKALGKD
jgi:hypothetical protein